MINSDPKSFGRILSIAQQLVSSEAERINGPVTPSLIEEVLERLAPMLPADFAQVIRDDVVDELIRRASHSIGRTATLSDGLGHVRWLNAERKKQWHYWGRYAQYMEANIPLKALDELDTTTDTILGHLEDPTREGAWDRRGLVVGHVQSGKTANYTGLICKAADAGYKIIIVLAGLHNNLRSQTQIRLDEGFLGFATLQNVEDLPAVGVGIIDSSKKPNYATNRSESGDFNKASAMTLGVSPEQRPWLFVVKKNKTVLARINKWISSRVAEHVDPETGRKIVASLPLLIIDDEADNGSVDTGEDVVDENGVPDREHQPSELNRQIRRILHQFARSAYVGYTATPFANIFIHEKGRTDELGPDLFPAAFIANLAAPSNYIGPGRVFGSASSAALDLPLVRALVPEDWNTWLPQKHRKDYLPRWNGEDCLPPTLSEAVRSFIYACAVRKLRRQGNKHCSMLVHVSRYTAVQDHVYTQISEYLRDLRGRYLRNLDLVAVEAMMRQEFENTFTPGMAKVRNALTPQELVETITWQDVRAVLPDVIEDIRVRQINGSAKDALDYVDNEGVGLKVIAVGGDKLARGLTLEGLTTSYFLRTAKMYDTLMQMGRWFGYRDGYLDVCRLYTTEEMIEWFGHIADAAEELRQEFDNMEASGGTPRDFGLRVRSHSVLTVTSRSKMRSAKPMSLTYAGDLLQTISFPTSTDALRANFDAAERLLGELGTETELGNQRFLPGNQKWAGYFWKGVSAADVTDFLRSYRTHGSSIRISGPLIAEFIDGMAQDGELTDWTVALIGKEDQDEELEPISNVRIRPIRRRAVGNDTSRYVIKVLTSPRDQSIDITKPEWEAALDLTRRTWRKDNERNEESEAPNEPRGAAIREVLGKGWEPSGVPARKTRGLLMIYLLKPDKKQSGILEQDAGPVVGWAISLPGSPSPRRVSTESTYMANSVMWDALNGWVD